MCRLDQSLLARAQQLRFIIQYGAGLEGVDIPYASSRGIWVGNIPSNECSNALSCAEHAIYLTMAVLRRQGEMQRAVKNEKLGYPVGQTLFGKRVLLIGFGGIGKKLIPMLKAFNVSNDKLIGFGFDHRVSCFSDLVELADEVCEMKNINEVLQTADIIILACPVDKSSRGMINDKFLSHCKTGVKIINIGRGALFDNKAVLHHLINRRIGGLGLDVFNPEPIDPNHEILKFENVILTPHIAGVTESSYKEMAKIIADEVLRLHKGEEPHRILNRHLLTNSLKTLAYYRYLWSIEGFADYEITYSLQCHCADEITQPVTIVYRDGRIESISEEVSNPSALPIVNDMFDIIENALRNGYTNINIAYDQDFGYPYFVEFNSVPGNDIFIETHLFNIARLPEDNFPATPTTPATPATPALDYDELQRVLDGYRNDWHSSGIAHYSFRFSIDCGGCSYLPDFRFEGEVDITSDGERITYVFPDFDTHHILLVDNLYDRIQEAITSRYVDIWPTYLADGIISSVRLQEAEDTDTVTYHLDVFDIYVFVETEPGSEFSGRKLFQKSSAGKGIVSAQHDVKLDKTSQ
eukprot:g6868.t1